MPPHWTSWTSQGRAADSLTSGDYFSRLRPVCGRCQGEKIGRVRKSTGRPRLDTGAGQKPARLQASRLSPEPGHITVVSSPCRGGAGSTHRGTRSQKPAAFLRLRPWEDGTRLPPPHSPLLRSDIRGGQRRCQENLCSAGIVGRRTCGRGVRRLRAHPGRGPVPGAVRPGCRRTDMQPPQRGTGEHVEIVAMATRITPFGGRGGSLARACPAPPPGGDR